MQAEGRFVQQTGGRASFAAVRVDYREGGPGASGVGLAPGAEDREQRQLGWLDAALVGARVGLNLARAPGRCTIIQVHDPRVHIDFRVTTPMLVAIAAIRAVWAAVPFAPGEEVARRLEACGSLKQIPLNDVGDRLRARLAGAAWAGTVDPAWLTPAVVAVARGIAEGQAFEHLPILADALLEAGCGDPDILAGCRAGPPDGGWVVDVLLGKEQDRAGGEGCLSFRET